MKDIFERHRICAALAISFGLFVMTPLLYMATDTTPCAKMVSHYIEPPEARSGEIVTIHWVTTADRACKGEVTRRLVSLDGSQNLTYTFGQEDTIPREPSREGEFLHFEKSFAVPNILPGKYEYSPLVKRWRSNVQRVRQQIIPTYETPMQVPFRVLPSELTTRPTGRLARQLP